MPKDGVEPKEKFKSKIHSEENFKMSEAEDKWVVMSVKLEFNRTALGFGSFFLLYFRFVEHIGRMGIL